MTENQVPAADPPFPPTPVVGRPDGSGPAGSGGSAAGGAERVGRRPGVMMAAAQLHVADLVEQDGALQQVTSLRLQGAPPTVSVALTGVPGRRSFAPDARLHVVRSRDLGPE